MNNDLISRSKAIAAVERREPLLIGDKLVSTDSLKNFLRNRPSVDAEPVRHGRWINGHCSQCGGHAPFWAMATTYYESPYCFECGAKMDLEEDTNG